MSSLQLRPGHWLLRCPLCKSGFTAAAGALACRNGHSFDLARQGYVNLLPGRRRRPAAGGDSPIATPAPRAIPVAVEGPGAAACM
jgi:23S rRNA (guanine745-N1)-methyltransferase